MLADRILGMEAGILAAHPEVRGVGFETIRSAGRVVLSPEVVEAASALRLPDDTPAPMPHPITWIEWADHEGHHGLGVVANDGLPGGGLGAYYRIYRKAGAEHLQTTPTGGLPPKLDFHTNVTFENRVNLGWLGLGRIGQLVGAAFFLMASPKVTGYREPDLSILNRNRERRGDDPLLSYREIILNLTPEERAMSRGDGSGPGKALHRCRAFMRVRTGRVEMVRAHWRGSAARGIVLSTHKVSL